MRIFSSTIWVLSAAIISSTAAQGPNFIFNGTSFNGRLEDFGGAASIFRLDDIKDGKNFTVTQEGGPQANIVRLDLMDAGNGTTLTLASWCPENGCDSTAGFSLSDVDPNKHNIILEPEVTKQLHDYVGAALYFRLDWQQLGGVGTGSSSSQEWSVAENGTAVTSIFQDYLSTMTAGGTPVPATAPAPGTTPSVVFNPESNGTTASPTSDSAMTTESAAENTGSKSKGLSTGAIVGIAVGSVGGVILVSVVAGCFCFRRRRDDGVERGGSRGVQDILAEKEAHASILDKDQPDTPYSEQNSQHPLHRGLGLAGRNESGIELGIGQAISGDRNGSVRTESLHTVTGGNDRNSVVYSSLGGAANSAHGTPVIGSGAFASGHSSPRAHTHTPSMSAHDRSSAMGSPVPRASSQLERSLSPYRDNAGPHEYGQQQQHHHVVDGADLVQQEHSNDGTARSPSSLYSNPLEEMQPISPESARENDGTAGAGAGGAAAGGVSGAGGASSSQPSGHGRSNTPSGIAQQYAHLVEEGMTDDEIRRLEEEERALDEAIEQAGTGGRKR